jgi:putative transposase
MLEISLVLTSGLIVILSLLSCMCSNTYMYVQSIITMEPRMYKYRLYPSHKQKEYLFNALNTCKEIYNHLLELSIKTYKFEGKTLGEFDYNKHLTGRYFKVHSQVKQNVSNRVSKSFKNFFRRTKNPSCKKKGFPRFKSCVHSITYPQTGFKLVSDDRKLFVSKIGNIPIVLHRTLKGKIKTMTIKVNKVGQWLAIFSCEVDAPKTVRRCSEKVGIDVGLEHFITVSNGEIVKNPHHIKKAEERLKRLQRRVSRKVKESHNRKKTVHLLAIQHVKVVNMRMDFLHKLSRAMTERYNFIAVEDLNVNGMVHNHFLAKYITDASWNVFIKMLEYKAVASGSILIKVNPRNTSRTCSRCGAVAEKSPYQRMFSCSVCGFACDRDLNASINILKVGQDLSEPNARGHSVRPPSSVVAVVDEPGTI